MKTVIIDGNNSLWRLAMRMPILTTADGDRIELVYGFFRLLHGCLMEFEPDNVIVMWDSGIPKLRIGIYSGYKQKRRESRENQSKDSAELFKLVMTQMEIIKDVLPCLSVCQYAVKDTEGDDLIAIACRCLPGRKIVVSGDKDMLQLVNKKVKVYLPLGKTRELYSHKNFEDKVGLTPQQFLEIKALIGDSGDEVPGIAKGFGEKSAKELIKRYGSAKNIWKNRRKVEKMFKRYANAVTKEAKENYHRNILLVDLSVLHSKSACHEIQHIVSSNPKCDELKVRAYFQDHQFRSLMKDFHSWIMPFKQLGGKHE